MDNKIGGDYMKEYLKSKLVAPEYDFLKDEPVLNNQIIYLVVSGSYGYGTNHEASDIDLRGCAVETKAHLFGLEGFEQYEELQTDTVIYGLKKFIKLGLSANPHILEVLGADESCIYKMSPEGKLLREQSELFLSQKVADSFGGYAMAQLRRLQNALARDTNEVSLKQQHIAKTLKKQLEQFNKEYTSFEGGKFEIYVNEEKAELQMDINLQAYPIKDFAAIYSNLTNTIRSYEKLTHRNNKKEETKLYKHAMHLVRLLLTGQYILEGKGIKTRQDEHLPMLLSIRHGACSWEEVFKIVDRCEKAFNLATQTSKLPLYPNTQKVEKLMMNLYECYYGFE